MKQFPAPLDSYLLPIIKEFNAKKKAVASDWRELLISQQLGARGYLDLQDIRLDVKVTGNKITPVISLKPVIGVDILDELEYYVKLFSTYYHLQHATISIISNLIASSQMIKENIQNRTRVYTSWDKARRKSVHHHLSLLQVVVAAANAGNLTGGDLDVISEAKDFALLEDLVRALDVGTLFSDAYNEGGSFLNEVNPDLCWKYWNYTNKLFEHGIIETEE